MSTARRSDARSRWSQVVLFVAGMASVAVIGWIAMQLWPEQPLPEGWLRLTPPRDVMGLVEYRGEIWSGGRDGVVVLDSATGLVVREVEIDVPLDYVTGLAMSPDGEDIWISHMRGVSHFDGTGWETLDEAEGLPPGRALAVMVASDGALWAGTEQGVARCQAGNCQSYTSADGLATTGCGYLFEDGDGRIWCGNGYATEAGVAIFEGGSWQPMRDQDRLAHPMLNTMLETEDGRLWLGLGFSGEGGLSVHDGARWQSYQQENGLVGPKVRYLFQDRAGAIWVGSEYNGILRLGSGGLDALSEGQHLTPEEGLAGWEVKAMLQDSRGTLWVGTELGLTRMSYDAWRSLSASE